MPARPVRRRAEPTAGPVIVDERLAPPVPAPAAAAPARRSTGPAWLDVPDRTGKRRTVDLTADDNATLDERVRAAARVAGVSSRELNAQHVIRALVHRFVTDQAFADSIMLDDVLGSRQ